MRAVALTFAGIFGAVACLALVSMVANDVAGTGARDDGRYILAYYKWVAIFWAATITSAVFFAGACAAGSPSRRPGTYRTTPGTLADPRGQLPPSPRREDPAEFLDSLR